MIWMNALRPAPKKFSIITAINDIAHTPADDINQLHDKVAAARAQMGPSQKVEIVERDHDIHVSIFTKFVKTRRYKLVTSLENNRFHPWTFKPETKDLADILDFIDFRIKNGTEQEIVDAMDLITPAMIHECVAPKAGISEGDASQAINALKNPANAQFINLLRILRLP